MTFTNPWRKRVVNRGVAESARYTDPRQLTGIADGSLYADDRIKAQQFESHRRVLQIDFSGSKRRDKRRRQRLDVNFEANGQSRCRSTVAIASCIRRTSVHNCSSPKVSKRKMA
jgi:hypothetical protein